MNKLSNVELRTLVALVEDGPLSAIELPSRAARTALILQGFAFPTMVKGSLGFTAATLAGLAYYKKHFGTTLEGPATLSEVKASRIAQQAIRACCS